MSNMNCQNCGEHWDSEDRQSGYYFRSASYVIGDYASPYLIDQATEDITFCPRCRYRGKFRTLDEALGAGQTQLDERGEKENIQVSSGGADVVHGGD